MEATLVQFRGFRPTHVPHPTPRLAGAPDISLCPQSRKDVLFTKAHEVFGNTSSVGEYYYLIRPYLGELCAVTPPPSASPEYTPALCVTPYSRPLPTSPLPICLSLLLSLGGAPLEELQYLAQANISMDIDTFTNLNPLMLKVNPRATSILFC